jgi:putative ABC transport system permease protein
MNWTSLLRALPRDLRETVAGDIEEEYLVRVARGRVRATLWAWSTAARLAVRFRVERVTHTRGVPPLAEEQRARPPVYDALRQDIVFSLRMLRRQPGFTTVAVAALALGIGASTAIFSVVDAVLWRPLPYPAAERVVSIAEQRPREGRRYGPVSPADFFDWRHDARSFAAIAATNIRAFNLTGGGEPERLRVLAGTAAFLDVLGVSPVLGRNFRIEEETFGRHRVVLLTDSLWRRRFAANPGAVGTTILFDGMPYEVVGVLPTTFWWPSPTDVLVPLALTEEDRRLRGAHFLDVIGRLKPVVPEQQAREELDIIGARLSQMYPSDNTGHAPNLRPLRDWLVGDLRAALLLLLGAVGCVLLIACANVATLLLARISGRQKELSVRCAVGATRGRLVLQMLTESMVVSMLGGAAGLLLATWSLAALRALLPAQFLELPGIDHIGLDGRMLAAAVSVTAMTAVVFGVVPALVASDQRMTVGLNEESRGSSGAPRTRRLRAALVVAELAVSLVLLASAGLLIVSFQKITKVSPGFQPQQLVIAGLTLPASRYGEPPQAVAFYEALMDRVRAIPGVQRVAVASAPPFSGFDARLDLTIEHQSWELNGPVRAYVSLVSPDYFQTIGVPLVRGRVLDERDGPSMPSAVVINEAAARRFWPGIDPLGQRINMDRKPRWMAIVGIVGDVRHQALNMDAEPQVYIPERQGFLALGTGLGRTLSLMVRTSLDGVSIAPAIRAAVSALDPQQPTGAIRTMDDMIGESVGSYRLNFLLVSAFAGVALLLTAAGLYGVMAYLVAQRTREIGVRMALGASQAQVMALVIRQAGLMTIAGVAAGIPCALMLARAMRTMLFGVSAADPAVYGAVTVLLVAVALSAAAIPSRRATRIDPLTAIRE